MRKIARARSPSSSLASKRRTASAWIDSSSPIVPSVREHDRAQLGREFTLARAARPSPDGRTAGRRVAHLGDERVALLARRGRGATKPTALATVPHGLGSFWSPSPRAIVRNASPGDLTGQERRPSCPRPASRARAPRVRRCASGERRELAAAVARAVDARAAGVHDDRRLVGDAASGSSPRRWRSTSPPSRERVRTGTSHDEPMALGAAWRRRRRRAAGCSRPSLEGHERVAALEDPGVHHVAHRLARGLLERVPQVGGDGVGVAVLAQVVADAVAEGRRHRGTARACAGPSHPSGR